MMGLEVTIIQVKLLDQLVAQNSVHRERLLTLGQGQSSFKMQLIIYLGS